MELLHFKLLPKSLIDVSCGSGRLQIFESGQVTLLLTQLHAILGRQLALIFLFKLVDSGWLDTFRRRQVEVRIHSTLILDELHHVMLHEGHSENINDLRTFLLVLHE